MSRWMPAGNRVARAVLLIFVGAVIGVLLLMWRGGFRYDVRDIFWPASPRDRYLASLRAAGLDKTALSRAWIDAADRALARPVDAVLPFKEEGYFAPTEPTAVGYRVSLRRGQQLDLELGVSATLPFRLFIELFEDSGDAQPRRVAYVADDARTLTFKSRRDGSYVLRVQPELLGGGRWTLTQRAKAALGFPVQGHDASAVHSTFGVSRDAGRREHHGIDIFAPRGTPALAATDGYVTSVTTNRLGGNVVWIWDPARHLTLYYAHLDTQEVTAGTRVRAGDVVGRVGNTGNARTTNPHLHFGIYGIGEGAIDPYPFVRHPPSEAARVLASLSRMGTLARTRSESVALRSRPNAADRPIQTLPRSTVLKIEAAAASSYRVRLPDDRVGYVLASTVVPADEPVGMKRVKEAREVRDAPFAAAPVVATIAPGGAVPILGRFASFLLVRVSAETIGWIAE